MFSSTSSYKENGVKGRPGSRAGEPCPAVRDFTSFGFDEVFNGRTRDLKGLQQFSRSPFLCPTYFLAVYRKNVGITFCYFNI